MAAEQKLVHRDFILCESCFWCASYIELARTTRCPVCRGSRLAKMPVK